MVNLTGSVEGIIYRSEESGYTVFVLDTGNTFETVTGTFPLIREGDFVRVYGLPVEHDTYGPQFKAERYELVTPETAEEIEAYLGSGIVRGIGPKLARDIVDAFGTSALEIIEHQPEVLATVRGIGKKKAQSIAESFHELVGAQHTVMFLQRYGMTPHMALKVFKYYGDDTVTLLQANPYRLVSDVEGIGFLLADRLASGMGVDPDSHFRVDAAVRYTLEEAGTEGHTFLPENMLIDRVAELLARPKEQIMAHLQQLAADQRIVYREVKGLRAVYHPSFFCAEAIVAGNLLLLQDSVSCEREKDLEKEIDAYQKEKKITLAEKQRQAVIGAVNNGICVITGGPGTGKTTTLDCLLHLFRKRGKEIALAAPTGRAAKRMAAATGEDAKTIHRLLEYTQTENGFQFKRNHDNPVKCDVCIVDEASMIDIFLMQALMEGLKKGTRLILVGDADQLPSVGAGNVLGDVIASGVFTTVALTEIFRQAGTSMIVTNAHRINRGEMPLVNTEGSDFFLTRRNNENQIASTVVDLCLRRLPQKYGISPKSDIQVLCPIKKGVCGVNNLNKLLQEALNPPEERKREFLAGEDVFREGDKVMQIRNNYDREWTQTDRVGLLTDGTGVFNGDVGVLTHIDTTAHEMTVRFEDDRVSRYDFADRDELTLAYAISVHKSQGCEFPFVVMPLPLGRVRIMTRNLFYTAVTRAQRMVVLTGSEQSVAAMISNTDTQKRFSALDVRLQCGKQLL